LRARAPKTEAAPAAPQPPAEPEHEPVAPAVEREDRSGSPFTLFGLRRRAEESLRADPEIAAPVPPKELETVGAPAPAPTPAPEPAALDDADLEIPAFLRRQSR
ncbi:MAG: hypothetical protein MI723_16995, partial [Caulobacterales bacterium]|nr:hypothetical protein [Caulobacterales bacterium]